MTEGDLCASCGGRLISIDEDLFRCEFCGKLYSDEKECSDIEAVRKLWAKGLKDIARKLMRDALSSHPDDPVYLLESLHIELDSDSVSDYLEQNMRSDSALDRLVSKAQFVSLGKSRKRENNDIAHDLEHYVDLRRKINGIESQNEYLTKIAEDRKNTPKKSFSERMKALKDILAQNIFGGIFAFCVGCAMVCLGTLNSGGSGIILAPVGGIFGIVFYVLYCYEAVDDAKKTLNESFEQNRKDVASLPEIKAEANALFASFKEHEKEIRERVES